MFAPKRIGMWLAGGLLLAVAAAQPLPALGSGGEDKELYRGGRTGPNQVLFPADRSGYPGELRDPRDVASYLAWHEGLGKSQQDGVLSVPTPNQLLYDARYYDLNLSLDPTAHTLSGVVTIRAAVASGPISELDLDLSSAMTVSSVTSGGSPAAFTRPANLLRVALDHAYATGEVVEIVVTYAGNPVGDSFGWDIVDGYPMIWTLSEPFGARSWWPCKDYSDDKADSVDIRVTVPTSLRIASNGSLRQEVDNGTTSFAWWHEGHPIATYLVSLAIHPYVVYSDWYHPSPADSMEIRFYNFASDIGAYQPVQALVKDMLGSYADQFGEYPFLDEKYGHAEFTWGGGMEHQTCTSLGFPGESVVAHELAHQWFGDQVTCETFNHVWLNEGFATYGEALWLEAISGPQAYLEDMLLNQYFGTGTIYVPTLDNWNRIFDSNLSYRKASWVLHMLRHLTGDPDFFQILRDYLALYGGSAATTEDFQAVCESVSGLDLDAFFTQWIYGEGAPIYEYTWSSVVAGGGYDVTVEIAQTQTTQLFDMPIDLRVTTEAGTQDFTVQNSLASQIYVLHVDANPTRVELDPGHWILRIVLEPIPTPSFDRGVLVVNGVDWDTYGAEIQNSYQQKAFWGERTIDFWDYFPEPAGGYPSTLPVPLGHGAVDPEVLGHYQCVVWVGNNFGGDLDGWFSTPIYGYLHAGGDVLFMSRLGQDFLIEPFRNYLGITWASTTTVTDCTATQLYLTNISRTGTQSSTATFNMGVTPPATLLYAATAGFNPDRGLGVYQAPPGGGTYRADGGKFVFLSGRPYRWEPTSLRTNVSYILTNFFGQPATAVEAGGSFGYDLSAATPNPWRGATGLSFSLPSPGAVDLRVFDVAGRALRTLASGRFPAGTHRVEWDGRDAAGRLAPSGVYFVRLESEQGRRERKLLRIE